MTVESEKRAAEDLRDSVELAGETMARLYEAQGFFQQALQARRGLFAEGLWRVVEQGGTGLPEDGLSVEQVGSALVCRWSLSKDLVAALQARMPPELVEAQGADVALRIASLQGTKKTFWDMHPLQRRGLCRLKPVESVDSLVVALGIRSGSGRFLPAFHSSPIQLQET